MDFSTYNLAITLFWHLFHIFGAFLIVLIIYRIVDMVVDMFISIFNSMNR